VSAGNVIIRHIRIRRGFHQIGDMGDGLNVKGDFADVMIDHVSTAWATDENLTLTKANRVTAQFSIAAEGLDYFNPNQSPNRHSEGSLFGSAAPGGQMTIHHSLYAHNRLRNARTTGGGNPPPDLDFRNNVIYDAREYTTHTGGEPVHLNLVNNYYKDGPSTGLEAKGVIFTFMKDLPYSLFAAGNFIESDATGSGDNWLAVRVARGGSGMALKDVRADHAFPAATVTTESAAAAYQTVLEEAGATLPAHDAVDLRIVRDVRNGTGAVINFETDVPDPGRWQEYRSLPAPADRNGDGIPDYWEKQFGLNPGSAMKIGAGGYSNIEHYLNNTDPSDGSIPIVYIAAAISRAYRDGKSEGAFRVFRTGPPGGPLTVNLSTGPVTIPAGATWVDVPVMPQAGDMVVAGISAGASYHIGCPNQALVAMVDGPAPSAVDIAKVDPAGGLSDAVRKLGEANMEQHKMDKVNKKPGKRPQD
jgi:hypothetical protein